MSVCNVFQFSNTNMICIDTLENTQRIYWSAINVTTLAQHLTSKNIRDNTTKSLKKHAHYAKRLSTLEWNYGAINNIATRAIALNTENNLFNRSTQPTKRNYYLEAIET